MDGRGILYIVATPIGNLEDITHRAERILSEVDMIAAEDTRRGKKLLSHLGISKPFVSHYTHNQMKSAHKVLENLAQGRDVALLTDAGTPGLSDPGAYMVETARKAGFRVVPIPGPSSLAAAVSISDIVCNSFTFAGFLPPKKHGRRKRLAELMDREEPLVFYEAPHRLLNVLEDMREIMGDRRALLAREITKVHEELISERFSGLIKIFSGKKARGEITIIVEGRQKEHAGYLNHAELRRKLKRRLIEENKSVKETVDELRSEYPLSRGALYREALKIKKGQDA